MSASAIAFKLISPPTIARPLPHFAGSSRKSFMAAEKRAVERVKEGRPGTCWGSKKLAVSWGRIHVLLMFSPSLYSSTIPTYLGSALR